MLKKFLGIIFTTLFLFGAKYTNALIHEESPYLRQHAHNPVNWCPWGKEAFEKAKKEHKPIFLSIGYSTCHWCHVMEKESFENEEIAKLINENFIPIKVDKEERPDLDKFYQTVFQVMHRRSGGWPLTIIMSEDKKPFFSATYIPPEDGYGVKGLKTILPILAQGYKEKREYLQKRGEAVLKLVNEVLHARYVPVQLDLSLANKALKQIEKSFDSIYGGFSQRVKFPQASTIALLLDIYLITHEEKAWQMAKKSLESMAKGGIYDQIEGGFFRYTTDRKWQIPHFEKMLYTNAELIGVYAKAYTIKKEPLFARVVQETIKELDSRFGYEGLYFSASDADSEGKEGGYFLYDYDETLRYLLKEGVAKNRAQKALSNLGIEEDGNFDSVLSNPRLVGKRDEKIVQLLQKMRKKRKYPFIDKKIITAWNAMYIDAKMHTFIFDEKYKNEALASLDRLLQEMYIHGNLYHQKLSSNPPTKEALLEDYAYLIKALNDAYMLSGKKRYLETAKELLKKAKEKFFKKGVWYFSQEDIELPADLSDSYYSSALATLYHAMLDIAMLSEDLKLYQFAKKSMYEKSALIYHDPGYYPTATRAFLRILIGDVVIKSQKIQNYLKEIAFIRYPYILTKKSKDKKFLACKIDTCFAESDNFAVIKEKIEKLLQQKSSGKWSKKALK
ncbi:thioredoxin domain-containing protein [Nitratiruptor tergarcus]|uniref:Spermatogenesis-associated protein 20-like TRX domain-containing protein n=1 Tax=Nitratiruptor tergarcus DSM 16512 TaxID=1069081 RepID=A0A1W1WSX9_9BACT|nr:thioredoxin domain-containing protein [Nitratiruptor tergarcus]SMC09411.1 hypothetical protein SAMN05660197_1218 [Nitratiruptor tergarcus DSM 16512]